MIWITLAILSSATYALVAVVDKHLIDAYMPTISTYYLWVAISVFVYGLVFLGIEGIPEGTSVTRLIVAGGSGLCWGGAMALTFWGFKLQEVSRASAVIFTFPVFVALFASMFLDETISYQQWSAIIIVVIGALVISIGDAPKSIFLKTNKFWDEKGKPKGAKLRLTRSFPILLGASLLTAAALLTGKYALQELSVGIVTSMSFFGTAAFLAYLVQPASFGQLMQVVHQKKALALLILSEGILIPIAVVAMITATKLGPVSLVATITGTRPIFIFFYSVILSLPGIHILNESLDRRTISIKLASVALIVLGIVSL